MTDALIRAVLTKIVYKSAEPYDPVPPPVEPIPFPETPDVDCVLWGGVLEFSVVENGSYAAVVPFEMLALPFGGVALPNVLLYDAVGGYCGSANPPATLNLRATVSGKDSLGNPVTGTQFQVELHVATDAPHPPPTEYLVIVDAENPVRRRRAKLWLYFTVGTMC